MKNLLQVPVVLAGFNLGEAQNFIKSYTDPLTTFLLWFLPIGGAIVSVVVIITWFGKDEDEREQRKPGKTLKKIWFWLAIGMGITTIFKILGISG